MHDSKNRKNNNKDKSGLSITRKTFLRNSALSLLALSPMGNLGLNFDEKNPNLTEATNSNHENILRTIEYNIFNGAIGYKGFNNTKPFPEEDEYHLVRAARKMGQIPKRIVMQLELYKPDIISFCESATEDTIKQMAKWLKMSYAHFPGSKDTKGHYPGTILTHYDIVSSKNRPFVGKDEHKDLFTRHWGKAKLRLPSGEMLTVHSAHLWPFTKNGGREIRLAEIKELLKSIHYDMAHNSESVILQGDLNHLPDTPEHRKLIEGGLVDTFAKAGHGNGYTATSKNPHARIDFIYAIGPIAEKIANCRPLYEGDFRLNNEDPKSFALSDHIPVLSDFKI